MNHARVEQLAAGAGHTEIPPASVIFGSSSEMSRCRAVIDRISHVLLPVFICGATGTGKEVLAQYIHRHSPVAHGPFLKVSCAALPGTLLEAELFGFEKNAFTGAHATKAGLIELAHGGTLLLDNISELDVSVQAKLLRFLQDGSFSRIGGEEERSVNVRIICTANDSLEEDLKSGRFREDVFHRISGVTLPLPWLRDRIEDLFCIADYLLARFALSFGTEVRHLTATIYRRLCQHPWPGNIRELENGLRRYSLLGVPSAIVETRRSPFYQPSTLPFSAQANASLKTHTQNLVRRAETAAILHALQEHDWNRQRSAESLNISVRTLLYKMRDAGISARLT